MVVSGNPQFWQGLRALAFAPLFCVGAAAWAEDGPDIGPGTAQVDAVEAARMFRDVCAATNPDFKKGEKALRELGFNQNTSTETFYHPDYDLSVNLLPFDDGSKKCSLVMVSKADPFDTSILFGGAVFRQVPEAEREKTVVSEMEGGQLHVTHPGIGTFVFETNPHHDKHIFHAILIAD